MFFRSRAAFSQVMRAKSLISLICVSRNSHTQNPNLFYITTQYKYKSILIDLIQLLFVVLPLSVKSLSILACGFRDTEFEQDSTFQK